MELELWILACLCAAFFTAGFIDSAAGGGGLITVPALLMANLPPDLALGTNKLAVAISMPASIVTYARSGFVLWKLAAAGAPAALVCGAFGPKAALYFSNEVLGKIIIFLLPVAIIITLLPKKNLGKANLDPGNPPYLRTALLCGVIGFYEGFFGPGSGSFFILGLHHFLGAGLIQSSATSKVVNVAASISALLVFIISGKTLYAVGIPCGVASLVGNVIGAKVVMRIGPAYVKKMLTLVLFLLMGSLIWKQFAG